MTRGDWAAELAGDLAVAYAEHAARPAPRETASLIPSAARFEHRRPLLRLAIETGIACSAQQPDLRALAEVVREDPRLLRELRDALVASFTDMRYEYGFVYGAVSWDQACLFRSGIVFLRELAGAKLDLEQVERCFLRWSDELFVTPLEIPAGMPDSHWWWFRPQP